MHHLLNTVQWCFPSQWNLLSFLDLEISEYWSEATQQLLLCTVLNHSPDLNFSRFAWYSVGFFPPTACSSPLHKLPLMEVIFFPVLTSPTLPQTALLILPKCTKYSLADCMLMWEDLVFKWYFLVLDLVFYKISKVSLMSHKVWSLLIFSGHFLQLTLQSTIGLLFLKYACSILPPKPLFMLYVPPGIGFSHILSGAKHFFILEHLVQTLPPPRNFLWPLYLGSPGVL